jgi:hypothetical protein
MTQKEKAYEIWDKMKGFRVTNAHRKKCCIVAIDLILQETPKMSVNGEPDPQLEWWQGVKKIIQDK